VGHGPSEHINEWMNLDTPIVYEAPRHAGRVVTGAISTTIISVIPVNLVGGLAVQISDELSLTPAGIGLAVSVYYGVTAFASVPIGRVVEKQGPARTSRIAIVLSGLGMLAIALLAHSALVLILLLAAAATANALGQLASNAALAISIPPGRQGITFAAKQSAIPFSSLVAGAAVPAIALTAGWRWAFVIVAALGIGALLAVPADPARPRRDLVKRSGTANASLVIIGIAAALGAGAAGALSAFLVDSTEHRGVSPGLAGLTLTLGSVICVVSRLFLGMLADKRASGHLGIVALLFGAGALGFILIGLSSPVTLVIGVVLGFGVGWAWPGLMNYAVVKRHPEAPAAATSVTQTGVYTGAGLGPLILGLIAEHAGYATMWPIAGGMLVVACILVLRS
jgi:MFS family permease